MKSPSYKIIGCSLLLMAAGTITSLQAQVDKTPVLRLSFDSVSGSTATNQGTGGFGMNGTLNGGAAIVAGGRFGNCLQITGSLASDASCRIANAVVPLNVGAGQPPWSVAMWFQTSTPGGCFGYQGDGGWAAGNTAFYLTSGRSGGGTAGNHAGAVRNSQEWEEGTTDVNDGLWHHYVLTFDGATKVMYLDGHVETFDENSWPGNGVGNQFWIGGNPYNGDGTTCLNGLIDEVYVFNQALSLSDVQGLTNNVLPIVPVSVTVSPASGYRGTSFTVTATVTPPAGTVTNVTANLSALGLSAATNLFLSSTPNVFTNRFTVPTTNTAVVGPDNLTATARTDASPFIGSGGATFTVVPRPPTNAIITAQLTNKYAYVYTEVSFIFGTTNDAPNDAPFPMTYTWYKNSVLVSTNPMGRSFTFLATPADNGAQIQAIASVADTNFSSLSVTSAVVTLTVSPGSTVFTNGLKREYFADATRQDAYVGNTAPGAITLISKAETPSNLGNNYAARFSGYFIPPTTDAYVFFLASDDDTDLFLSTDSTPANKTLIAQEGGWSGTLNWLTPGGGASSATQKRSDQWSPDGGTTVPWANGFYLTAGNLYYIEAVQHQGGGGDNFAITYQTTNEIADVNWPVNFTNGAPSRMTVASNNIAVITWAGTNINWATQPPPAVTVYEGDSTNLISLARTDAEMLPTYQWYIDNTNYPGATSPNFNLAAIPASYNGVKIKVVATTSEGGLSITSSVTTLTVLQSVLELGFIKNERWDGPTSVAQIPTLGSPNYVMAVPGFGVSQANPNIGNNRVRRVTGYFIPPVTANYNFHTTSDDDSDFFISTDNTPVNKRLVCHQGGWNGGGNWQWGTVGNSGADPTQTHSQTWLSGGIPVWSNGIPLIGGQRYYIEQDMHQGGGGANNAVTYSFFGDPDPVPGTITRLIGNQVAMLAIRCQYVNFTNQPQNATAPVMGYATFSAGGTTDSQTKIGNLLNSETSAANQGTLFFRWFKNGVLITNANAPTLTVGPLYPSDNGAVIQCQMRALGYADNALNPTWSNSLTATITVTNEAVFEPGYASVDWWSNSTSRILVEQQSAGSPTLQFVLPSYESPLFGSTFDNYVNRVRGLFIPPATSNYVFFVCSDDDSDLFINTNGPSPSGATLIAQENVWSGGLNWLTAGAGGAAAITQKRSDSWSPDGGATIPYSGGFPLTAGQMYWLDAVHHEGGGGDNFGATFRSIGETDPANGTRSRLTGSVIGTYVPRIPWVAFLQQPTNVTVTSGGNPATFYVNGSNAPGIWVGVSDQPPLAAWAATPPNQFLQYQWYKNGTPIPGATASSYTQPYVLPSDQGAQFVCGIRGLGYADNSLNRIYSNSTPAVLTVVTDTVPPTITYAATFANTNQPHLVVSVTFSEWMDAASAGNAANYTISGVNITNVIVASNHRTVLLLVDALPTLPLNVTVSGVKDLTGNTIAPSSTSAIRSEPLTFTDVGTPGLDPAYPSFVSVTASGGYLISAEGSDIWNTADGCHLAWKLMTNNFDVYVRGVANGHSSQFAKMGLMVRETLDAGSRNWNIVNDPNPNDGIMAPDNSGFGANNVECNMRDTANGASAGWKNLAGNTVPAYPNAWVRLKRTGDLLEAFASTNGVLWVPLARYNTATNVNGALTSVAYVGLCVTAHNNDPVGEPPPYKYYNTAEFANFTSVPILTISRSGANVIVSWNTATGHLESSPAVTGPGVNWQTVGTANPATVPIGTGPQYFRVLIP